MHLKDSSALRCESWDVVWQESTAPNVIHGIGADGTPIFTIAQDFASGNRNGDPSSNNSSGCHFKGARRDFNSAYQTVALGNCRDCSAIGNYLEGTPDIFNTILTEKPSLLLPEDSNVQSSAWATLFPRIEISQTAQ
jgi:hypothetical protein